MHSVPDAGTSLRPDPELVQSMLHTLIPDGEPFEIRTLHFRKVTPDGIAPDPFKNAQSGFYTDIRRAASHATRFTGRHCAGVYVTLHQLAPYVLNWGAERIAKGRATSDADVMRYRYLYLDLDPTRPSDTNATSEEHARSRARLKQVMAFLRDADWPEAVWAGSSGNGHLLLYRIDLPVGERLLYERVLQSLNTNLGDKTVTIDTSVGNPARLIRLAGTINAKAITPQPDRPWRLAKGQGRPDAGTVSRECLQAIAGPEPQRETSGSDYRTEPSSRGSREQYNLPVILEQSRIPFRTKEMNYGTVYEISDCLTSSDHWDGACFIQFSNGAVDYTCRHERCRGKGWQDVKPRLVLPSNGTPTLSVSRSGVTRRLGGPTFEIRDGRVVPL